MEKTASCITRMKSAPRARATRIDLCGMRPTICPRQNILRALRKTPHPAHPRPAHICAPRAPNNFYPHLIHLLHDLGLGSSHKNLNNYHIWFFTQLIHHFKHLYIELCMFKNYKKLILWKYAIRRFKQDLTWLYFFLHICRNIYNNLER